jgi:OOP family OmpA-OmpF porin
MARKIIGVGVLGLAAAAFMLPASAQTGGSGAPSFHAGVNVGQSKVNLDCDGSGLACDDSDTAFKLYAGYQLNRNLAAELGYADLGKATLTGPGGRDEIASTAWDLTGLFGAPIGNSGLSVFGRLGLYVGDVKLSGPDHGTKTNSGLTFGLGGEFDFTRNLGLRAEWQRYAKMKVRNDVTGVEDDGDVDALTVGLLYRFR